MNVKVKQYSLAPLVSILIPTYNRPAYFVLALESALKQTYANIEIIVGDDSTNFETEQIVKEQYLGKYPNIIYYHNEKNIGQFDNDIKLFQMAQGQFINYLMDDDLFDPVKIEKMMAWFLNDKNEEISLVTSHRGAIDKGGQYLGVFGNADKFFPKDTVLDGAKLSSFILMNNFNCIGEPTTVLFRKNKLKEPFGVLNGRKAGCNVDLASWFNLLSVGKAVYISEVLSFFRRHEGQQLVSTKMRLLGAADYVHEVLTAKDNGCFAEKTNFIKAVEQCKTHCDKVNREYEFHDTCENIYKLFKSEYEKLKSIDLRFNSTEEEIRMKQFPLVSILIPTYNQTHYLKAALESAINQTYSNIEIVISDDSNNDEVEKFLQPYLKCHSNIYYLKNERSEMDYGLSNCLNLFSKSRGEYVNFLFHDDVFHVSKIERMMNYFIANPQINLVTSYRQLIDEDGVILPDEKATKRLSASDVLIEGRKLGEFCLENLLNFIGEPTTVLFKKEALEEGIFRFNGKTYSGLADVATWLSLLKSGDAVYLCDSLSVFRKHKEQNTFKPSIHIVGIVEWKEILDDAYQIGYFNKEQHKQMIEKWFISFNYILRNTNFLQIDCALANRLQTVFKEAIDVISH